MKILQRILLASSIALMPLCVQGQENRRWTLAEEGHISWNPQKTEVHHMEIAPDIYCRKCGCPGHIVPANLFPQVLCHQCDRTFLRCFPDICGL